MLEMGRPWLPGSEPMGHVGHQLLHRLQTTAEDGAQLSAPEAAQLGKKVGSGQPQSSSGLREAGAVVLLSPYRPRTSFCASLISPKLVFTSSVGCLPF